jgi:putative serine protease PepD
VTPSQADAVSFCTACGSLLDPDGACPTHGAPTPVPSRPRRWVLPAVTGLVLVVIGVALAWVRSDDRARSRRLQQAVAELNRTLADQAAAANGLSRRLGEVESRLEAQPDPAEVARRVAPAVFTVEAGDSVGSAFAVSSSGGRASLVTNFHVVEEEWGAGRRKVRLRRPDRDLEATVDQVNRANDLALLTVAVELPTLPKAASEPVVGDPVLVVGSPLGLGGTVSNGIVSAFREGYIQFSAPIGPGNSGGPVVNRKGEVIGVARSKLVAFGAEGLSFAIPIALACSTMKAC